MYCSYEGCNERVLKPVPAIGYHDWDTEHTECLKKATCTEQGTMRMHCKRDASHTMTYDYGGTGHVWDEGVITTPPTYDEYGEKTLNCKNCDLWRWNAAKRTAHSFPTSCGSLSSPALASPLCRLFPSGSLTAAARVLRIWQKP